MFGEFNFGDDIGDFWREEGLIFSIEIWGDFFWIGVDIGLFGKFWGDFCCLEFIIEVELDGFCGVLFFGEIFILEGWVFLIGGFVILVLVFEFFLFGRLDM